MEAHNGLSARIAREAGFDLARLARLQDQRDTPFSRAVQAFYTLVEALREFAGQGGRAARDQRYAHLGEQVRAGLTRLGIEAVVPPEHSSVVLRAYHLPTSLTYATLHDTLKAEGFVIYAGQGELSKTLFRISTMGNLISADIDRMLNCFARVLRSAR